MNFFYKFNIFFRRKESAMTERLELYRCDICGNIVEVVINGEGELVCCGEPMKRLEAGTNDNAATEKHVPVFRKTETGGMEIRVGSEPHPMIPEHYVMFIEVISNDKNYLKRKYLYPDNKPELLSDKYMDNTLAREYCNIHGLWEATSD